MPDSPWLIYGANGYTGQRIAREAANRRMKPILAGRNAREIGTLAAELKCPSRVFSLSGKGLADHLRDVRLVLNCAGPFTATGEPMMDACLAAKAHYLDITGEIPVIEAAAARHDRAVQAGVSVIPACGFDVVPSDCLAAMLAARLPGAIRLELAFAAGIRISRGTARTIAERIAHGGQARQDGKIVAVPLVWKTMQIPFRGGPQWAVTIAWGDVAAAWHTTGIPNIEVYTAMPPERIAQLRRLSRLLPLLRIPPIRAMTAPVIRRFLTGFSPQGEQPGRASLWGRVSDAQGNTVEATLETPEGYRLTVLTALAAVEKVLSSAAPIGFATPARAFGREFILSVPETAGWHVPE